MSRNCVGKAHVYDFISDNDQQFFIFHTCIDHCIMPTRLKN